MKKKIANLLVLFSFILLISCKGESEHALAIFDKVKHIVDQYPDSALLLLDSIQNPYELNKSEFAEFVLRSVQARHKAEKDIGSDTLIFDVNDYYREKNDSENLALSTFYCGQVLQSQNKLEKATAMYLKARTLADKTNNIDLSILADFYIGFINYKQYLSKEARTHLKQADAKIAITKRSYKNEIAIKTYITNSFFLEEVLDSALVYYTQGLAIAEKNNDLDEQITLKQIMSVAFLARKDTNSSKKTIKSALSLSTQIPNKSRLPEIYLSLSEIFQAENQVDSALYYTDLALKAAGDYDIKAIIYDAISRLEESRGNYQKGLEYFRIYADYADSIYNQKQDHNIIAVQKKYNFEMMQNANQKLTIEKLWITIALIVSAFMSMIIVFYIYKKRTRDKEALFLAKQQIYQLKEIVTKRDKKEDDNNEVNKKLRTALIEQLDIIKKVSLLEGFISDGDQIKLSGKVILQKVNKIIYKSTDDLDWSAFFQTVNALYDDFLVKLAHTYPTLTEDEILICCLLKIGLSNEEIRLLLKSTTNIIQKKKSSIREKTGMKKQEHFVKQLDNLLNSQ